MLNVIKSAGTTVENVFSAVNETSYLAVDTVKVARSIVKRSDGLVNHMFDALEKELKVTPAPKAPPKPRNKSNK